MPDVTSSLSWPEGLTITGALPEGAQSVLTPEALTLVRDLARTFTKQRTALLVARGQVQETLNAGGTLDFLPETENIREGNWSVAPIPADLQDRRVEITGPAQRKMVINGLNSGAKVFMADFEDSLSPRWDAVVQGQINLRDAVARTISYASPEGKSYRLNDETAVLIVRPRGWHLDERHVQVDNAFVPGAFFDFAVYLATNARALLARGTGPYFYLPKLEHYHEAELWCDVFDMAEKALGLPHGTIKATVLIETIPAAFQMDEILYALRDYCVALNCGRWDYIFSVIKKFHTRNDVVLPDRGSVVMTTHFLRSYSLLLIRTTHKRGALAMGGMSAFIPVKNDAAANDKALASVRADKEREAGDGHDGTWVAHPALVPIAREVFDRVMPGKNQLDKKQEFIEVSAADLLTVPHGAITEAGVRGNLSVALQYIAAWLDGNGCVPINNLMEDAATAEIARSQLWQWIHHPAGLLEDGGKITFERCRIWLAEEQAIIKTALGDHYDAARHDKAAQLLLSLIGSPDFTEFLTLPGYAQLLDEPQ